MRSSPPATHGVIFHVPGRCVLLCHPALGIGYTQGALPRRSYSTPCRDACMRFRLVTSCGCWPGVQGEESVAFFEVLEGRRPHIPSQHQACGAWRDPGRNMPDRCHYHMHVLWPSRRQKGCLLHMIMTQCWDGRAELNPSGTGNYLATCFDLGPSERPDFGHGGLAFP